MSKEREKNSFEKHKKKNIQMPIDQKAISKSDKFTKVKSIIEFVFKDIAIILGVVGTVYSLYSETAYKKQISTFYGIPEMYFSYDIKNNVFILLLESLPILIIVIPFIYKKYHNKLHADLNINISLFKLIIYLAITTCVILLLRLIYFSIFMDKIIYSELYQIQLYQFGTIIAFFITEFVLITLFQICVIYNVFNNAIAFSNKIKKILDNSTLLFSTTITCFAIYINIVTTNFILEFPTNADMQYEFVEIDNENYVVISHYNSNLLIAPATVDDDGNYTFYTANYTFCSLTANKYKYEYVKLNHLPTIDKTNDKIN